jgi:hypothetical protein
MAEGKRISNMIFDISAVATLFRYILRSDIAVGTDLLGARNIKFMERCVKSYMATAIPLSNTPGEEEQAASR